MTAQHASARPARRLGTDRFLFGGDYNPEQWPEEVWAQDVALMRRAGVNAATVGVFSWALLEPSEGTYDFGWLDRVLATLHEGGIGVVLATPTASPPPWFTRAHPDAMPVDADGRSLVHGSRDTYAVSAPAYRDACRAIAGELAARYGDHPALIAWHVHNEYGTLDHGEHAAAAFRRWLRRRYGTLEELNRRWYTAFWSQGYSSWEDVLPPRRTQYLANPTHALDFKRFSSDEMLDALREQRDVIRATGSPAPVTTNFMLPSWNHLEQWGWSAELDLVSVDHYLDTTGPDGETHAAYGGDLTRSWAGGGPWLLMEQSSTSSSLPGRRAHKEPDRVVRNSLSYVARGSQGALFFQWRAPLAGSEAWHGGIVPHAGAESRSFRGFEQLGRVLESIAEVAGAPADGPLVLADVAVVWHAEGWWATDTHQLPSDDLDYSATVRAAHRALWQEGFAVDFVAPDADLSRYRLVLVPSMFALGDAAVERLRAHVSGGGHLAVWPFTGYADEHLHVVPGGYPGRLRDLLGVRVEELHPLGAGEQVVLEYGDGELTGTVWSEVVDLDGAEVVARYRGGELDGAPAVTRCATGRGVAHYASTFLVEDSLRRWLRGLCAQAGVSPVVEGCPPLVEVVRRRGARADYLFVLNHSAAAVRVTGPGHDLTTGSEADAGLDVAARGWAVLRIRDGAAPWRVAPAG
ncbi:beta-galactosidase [Kineococcus rubinsiae]|uniref:beta-galactosidase n=1 Tax=Kineococcus rubinsiae TaxID=2609562 RepID=UPI00143043CA|nr:beta-galactosidase [Kineococcus rubinsiae]NIZ89870.1 beta-galactosidase [Kineococcus rubinsiae]